MRYAHIPFILMTIMLSSCLGTAKLSDLPKTADEINFDTYAKGVAKSGGVWSFKTSTEYYLETATPLTQDTLITIIRQALISRKYAIQSASPDKGCITASHAMTMNEYYYVTGVYYKLSPGKTQLYIRTTITQDITGGAKNNLSEKLGLIIASLIK